MNSRQAQRLTWLHNQIIKGCPVGPQIYAAQFQISCRSAFKDRLILLAWGAPLQVDKEGHWYYATPWELPALNVPDLAPVDERPIRHTRCSQGNQFSHQILVTLSDAQIQALDTLRGDEARSVYLRNLFEAQVRQHPDLQPTMPREKPKRTPKLPPPKPDSTRCSRCGRPFSEVARQRSGRALRCIECCNAYQRERRARRKVQK